MGPPVLTVYYIGEMILLAKVGFLIERTNPQDTKKQLGNQTI